MNNISLIGRIGNSIELKKLESGNSVTSFNLAVKGRGDKTVWIRIVAWNKTAELLNNYTKKGDMIGITGRLDVREYEKNNEKRTAYEVVAEQIHFCGSKKDKEESQEEYITNDGDLPF